MLITIDNKQHYLMYIYPVSFAGNLLAQILAIRHRVYYIKDEVSSLGRSFMPPMPKIESRSLPTTNNFSNNKNPTKPTKNLTT